MAPDNPAADLAVVARSLTDAARRGWGEGWPTDRSDDVAVAEGGGIVLSVHDAIVPIVAALLDETVALGYPLDRTQCGGYANLPMKRTDGSLPTTPSNHSWGLAVDLNWRQNGFGRRAPHDIPERVVQLWEANGFHWGGHWTEQPPDFMHFEFNGTPADAVRIAASPRCRHRRTSS